MDKLTREELDRRARLIADQIKLDVKKATPKNARRAKDVADKRQPIKEVDAKKDFSGEASPYWDFIEKTQRQTEEGVPTENIRGNPDLLSEEDSLYNRPLTEEGELRIEAVREALPELSAQQKKVLHLCGFLGYTWKEAADVMNIKEATVQTLLNRARQRIQRCYGRRKAATEK